MEKIKVCIQRLAGNEDIPLPQYMTNQSAGMDIFAAVPEEEIILPGQRSKVPTGIAVALPEGYEAQIRPRSGLALNNGVTLLNSPGTIDADYRGEICVILINCSKNVFTVTPKMRIAQLVLAPVCQAEFVLQEQLVSVTARGMGGFGSTGTN